MDWEEIPLGIAKMVFWLIWILLFLGYLWLIQAIIAPHSGLTVWGLQQVSAELPADAMCGPRSFLGVFSVIFFPGAILALYYVLLPGSEDLFGFLAAIVYFVFWLLVWLLILLPIGTVRNFLSRTTNDK